MASYCETLLYDTVFQKLLARYINCIWLRNTIEKKHESLWNMKFGQKPRIFVEQSSNYVLYVKYICTHSMVVFLSKYLAGWNLEMVLGNTILVKLELWELVIVFNNKNYSATNLCLCYASIFSHMVTPTMFPWDKKRLAQKNPEDKKVLFTNVLIPF